MRRLGAILALAFALALAFSQPASADGVGRTYPLTGQPRTIAIDPTDGRLFVANPFGTPSFVTVIDPASGQVTNHPTSGTPNVLALDPVHDRLYVAHFNQTLDVFDTTTMSLMTTLPVYAVGLAVDTTTQRVYAAGATVLTVIDGTTNTVLTTRPALANEDWFSVAVDPALHRVYVTNYFDWPPDNVFPSLIMLDDRDLSIITELRLPVRPRWGLAVDQLRHRVYVAGPGTSATNGYVPQLVALDGTTLAEVGSATVLDDPTGIAFDEDRIYVTSTNVGGFTVVDATTFAVERSLSTLPLRPFMPAVDPQGRFYFGALSDGTFPHAVVLFEAGNHAPIIRSAFFTPSAPTTDKLLTYSVTAIDGDFAALPGGVRDPVTLTYEWTRNGSPMTNTSSSVDLWPPGAGDRGDAFTGRVIVTDPEGLTASASASVVIANSVPLATVSLNNPSPDADDVLTASVLASDADGDQVTLAYAWLRNGGAIAGETTSSLDLAAHSDLPGATVTVRVTASDGHGGVKVATATALVIPTTGTFLYMKSQTGDFVGRGLEHLFMSSSSAIQGFLPQGGDTFRADINQGTRHWGVSMSSPRGVPLAVGAYTGAVRSAFRPDGTPGLDVSGEGRGCNTLTGQFNVTEIAYSPYNELMLFAATFEQHCEGAVPALFGRIRVEIPPPTPGVTLPAGSIAVPTSGTFLYLNSQPGDFVGGGVEALYKSSDSKIYGDLPQEGDYFRASIVQGSAHWWDVDIASPPGQPLALGSYIRAVRAVFRPAGSPGLDVRGDGRSCSTANAKFDIDELTFAFGEMVTFQADFEQPCGTASLFGRIRIENPAATGPGITLPTGSIAVPASGSFLYMNSEAGEYVGRGIEQLFTSADSTVGGSMLTTVGDYFRGGIVQGNNVHNFMVDIAAPAGQPLAVGNYVRASRASFRPAGSPGLDVSGDGRGYNDLTGRFDVDVLSFWPNGDIKVFQATFRIGAAGPKLYGRFRLETAPPLQLSVTISGDGSVVNKTTIATVKGTVSCSRPGPVDLTGTLTQSQAKGVVVTGPFSIRIDCTAPSVAWSASVAAESGKFTAGSASTSVSGTACEPERQCVSATVTRSVKLNLGK